jgi:hypothetical protein
VKFALNFINLSARFQGRPFFFKSLLSRFFGSLGFLFLDPSTKHIPTSSLFLLLLRLMSVTPFNAAGERKRLKQIMLPSTMFVFINNPSPFILSTLEDFKKAIASHKL